MRNDKVVLYKSIDSSDLKVIGSSLDEIQLPHSLKSLETNAIAPNFEKK